MKVRILGKTLQVHEVAPKAACPGPRPVLGPEQSSSLTYLAAWSPALVYQCLLPGAPPWADGLLLAHPKPRLGALGTLPTLYPAQVFPLHCSQGPQGR